MTKEKELKQLCLEYDRLQDEYGDKSLNSVYFGGCIDRPLLCFVFMNPTKKTISSEKTWRGYRAPWIGTKNIWDLFYALHFIDDFLYKEIKEKKGSDWTEAFAQQIYDRIEQNKIFITNLAKCTQTDARSLPDQIYEEYLELFLKEIDLVNPKVIVFFGNQVSRVVLKQKIAVSQCRKKRLLLNGRYPCYAVYYPIGNGRFHLDKSIEDLNYIINQIQ